MSSTSLKTGYSTAEIIMTVVIVAIIGLVGYTFYKSYQAKTANDSAVVTDVPKSPVIKDTNDLDEASAVIDQMELESNSSGDLTELDKELAEF